MEKKKVTAFNEARPRTPKGDVHQREIEIMRLMGELVELGDEDEYKRRIAERFGIVPGNSRYEKAISTWRALRGGKP